MPGIVSALITIVMFGTPLFAMVYLAIRLRLSRQRQIASAMQPVNQ